MRLPGDKTAIFGGNVARLHGYNRGAELGEPDRLIAMKEVRAPRWTAQQSALRLHREIVTAESWRRETG